MRRFKNRRRLHENKKIKLIDAQTAYNLLNVDFKADELYVSLKTAYGAYMGSSYHRILKVRMGTSIISIETKKGVDFKVLLSGLKHITYDNRAIRFVYKDNSEYYFAMMHLNWD